MTKKERNQEIKINWYQLRISTKMFSLKFGGVRVEFMQMIAMSEGSPDANVLIGEVGGGRRGGCWNPCEEIHIYGKLVDCSSVPYSPSDWRSIAAMLVYIPSEIQEKVLSFYVFMIITFSCSGMLQNVRGCSVMFFVPGFTSLTSEHRQPKHMMSIAHKLN